MEFYTEIRLKGDEYGGNYTNGLTLSGSSTLYKLETDKSDINKTVYKTADGITVNCYHEKQGEVIVCKSEFINNTDSTLTLELLSSFAVKGIKADKIHRVTSFWSAEGKLLTQKLTDLNMECSWAKHGVRIEKFGQIGSMPVRKWFPFLYLQASGLILNHKNAV